MAMLGAFGVTAIDSSVAPVTVNVAVPETAPEVAVIVVEPAETPRASPPAPIVALDGALELQVAVAVRSWVLESV